MQVSYFTSRSLRVTAFFEDSDQAAPWNDARCWILFLSSGPHNLGFPITSPYLFPVRWQWKCFCCCFLDMLKYLQINTIPLSTPHAQEAEAGLQRKVARATILKPSKVIIKRAVISLVLRKWDLDKSSRLHQRCSSNAHCDYDDPVEVHIQLLCSGDENHFFFLTDFQYLTSILMQRPTLKNLASYLNQSHSILKSLT